MCLLCLLEVDSHFLDLFGKVLCSAIHAKYINTLLIFVPYSLISNLKENTYSNSNLGLNSTKEFH